MRFFGAESSAGSSRQCRLRYFGELSFAGAEDGRAQVFALGKPLLDPLKLLRAWRQVAWQLRRWRHSRYWLMIEEKSSEQSSKSI